MAVAPAAFAADTCSDRALYIVAHEDDSLLFQSPDLARDIESGACVTTVYVTAGDDGGTQSYWSGREVGALAGYASMAGVENSWDQSETNVAGHQILTYSLTAAPRVVQMFLRLPDGRHNGSGFPAYGNESLQKLWMGAIGSVHPVDGSAAYTARGLVNTLGALMTSTAPSDIRVQDYMGRPGGGDHSDHYFTAYFARAAQQLYAAPHHLIGYEGYNSREQPENVTDSGPLSTKTNAFYAYGADDPMVCDSAANCAGSLYAQWLPRQYTVNTQAGPTANVAPTANAGSNRAVVPGATVALDGFGSSDPNGDLLTYKWTQTTGPTVTLSGSASAIPMFTAPADQTSLGFQLTVNDGLLDSKVSDVTINVVPVDLMAWTTIAPSGPEDLVLSFRHRPGFVATGATCEITMGQGTAVPPVDAPVVYSGCVTGSAQAVVHDLAANNLYTFAMRTRYAGGAVSAPDVRRAMTRTVAGYVASGTGTSDVSNAGVLPGTGEGAAALAIGSTGVANSLFVRTSPAGASWVYYASRRPGAGWSGVVRLGSAGQLLMDRPLFLSLGPKGRLVAGWTVSNASGDAMVYRVRPPGTTRWRSLRHVPAVGRMVGLIQDKAGALHLLSSTAHALTYRTNVTRAWTAQPMPRASWRSTLTGGLGYDPVTNRVTIAYSDASAGGTTVVRVADAVASRRGFAAFYRRAAFTTPISGAKVSVAAVTGVTAYGGRITLGLRRAGDTPAAGSYVMSGSSASKVAGLTRIAGTTALYGAPWTSSKLAAYGGPVVNAVSPTRVLISFTRISPTWQPRDQGVFLVVRVYHATTHRWTFTTPVQRSRSPYDRPVSAARDRSGHVYVAYFRTGVDLDLPTAGAA